jgi:hypothetical protein
LSYRLLQSEDKEEAEMGYWDSEEEKYVDEEEAEEPATGLGPPGARGGEEAVSGL